MAEIVLANPLSGLEVIEAVVDQVRTQMRKDCNLNVNSAYDWYDAEINMHDAGSHIKGDYTAKSAQGSKPSDGEEIEQAFASFDVDPASPNEVRVATGQDVPVLTKGENGEQVVKGVRYKRADAKKAGKA
jgi:hypothetical protein